MARNPPQWLRDLRLNWDAVSFQWSQWVVGYDSERQFAFLSRFGIDSLSAQAINMLAGLALIIGLFALYMLRHLFTSKQDKTQAAWVKLCRKLARSGLSRAPHEGPHDYAMRVAASRPDLAECIQDLTARYLKLRYGAIQDEIAQREFIHLVAKFPLNPKK